MQDKRKEKETAIGCLLCLAESSVRAIWCNKDEIQASIKAFGASKLDTRKHAPNDKVIKMKRYLGAWINKKDPEI